MSSSDQYSTSQIRIDRLETDGTELTCQIDATSDLQRFFTGDPFHVSYDVSIESVPDGILVVPVLSQLCPVAWATGADVYVPELDETFARALEDVKATLLSMYPDFLEGGRVYAKRTVDCAVDERDALEGDDGATSGLLFTGGVDSTCSYIRHREEAPTLISIRGWTISPSGLDDQKWDDLRSRVSTFADERDLETSFVESNMLSFLDHPMLLAHFKRYVDGGWYSSVGHGLGLLGLCAPMAHARGMSDLYVAATHWNGIDLEWGSRPDIDDYVRWGGTRCHHDAYDLTRQERLDVIADYAHDHAPELELQTCNVRMDGNCGECEKCYRTAVGLRLSGLDPNDHGYPFSETSYHDLRRSFERGSWILGEDERYMWEDIRHRVREVSAESAAERAFFSWLCDVDLQDLVDDSEPPLRHRLLRAGARNVPNGVYSTLYPAWSAAKNASRRFGT